MDPGFANVTGLDQPVFAITLQADKKLICAGDFTTIGTANQARIARLNSDGTLDQSFDPGAGANSSVYAVAVQADGKIVAAGNFTQMRGETHNRIVRFNIDGSLDSGFNAGDGANNAIYSLVVLPNGQILIGGAFTSVAGQPRGYLARLRGNGSLDPTFTTSLNSSVWAMGLGGDGKLVLAGDFTSVLGTLRNRVARLNADGSLDDGFDPAMGPNATVRALVLQPDGKVLLGGHFSAVNGLGYTYLCRLNADGLPDLEDYRGSANNLVYALVLQPDGRLVVGGEFTALQGQTANRLGRLLGDGTMDPSFDAGAGANSTIIALALQPDGNLVAGGSFTQFNTVGQARLVRVVGLSAASGGELEFSAANYRVSEGQPNVSIEVRRTGTSSAAVVVNYATSNGTANAGDYTGQSGKLNFGAGETKKTFTVPIRADAGIEDDETVNLTLSNPTGGAVLGGQRIATLHIANDDTTTAVGGVDTHFTGGSYGVVYATAVQPDGKLMAAGEFTGLIGGSRVRVGRLNTDGTLDGGFNPAAWLDGTANVVVVQSDGRVLVGGSFTIVNGVTRNRLARFNADGTLDSTFNPGIGPNSTVYSLLVQPNGDILVGGAFSAFNNEGRSYLARLYSDGSLDPEFNLQVNSSVWAMELGIDGKLVLAGDFTSVLGTTRNRVARLKVDESIDEVFDPGIGPNSTVRALAVQPDGRVVIGGAFGSVNGQGFTHLARLNPDGLADLSYAGYANNVVYSLALQPDGRLLMGGEFTAVAGQPANRVARLLGHGTPDPSFDPGTGANATVFTLALQADGNVVAGGNFTQFNGLDRSRLVRVLGLSSASGGELEFSAAEYRGSEAQPSVTIDVRRRGATAAAVTINYATSNGTANAGDYTPQSGKLSFAAGETQKTFTVPLRADAVVEDNETVNLTLSGPTGGAELGGQRTATLYIVNDDSSTAVGEADTSFAGGAFGVVYDTAVQTDGKVMVVGEFSGLLGGSRLRVGRLNSDGTLDASFNPSAWLDNTPNVVVVQSDGRVLVGGAFTVANGATRNRLVRFNADGTLDLTFNPGIGPNSTVYSLLVQANGDILVGGAFSAFNNESRGYLVRLYSDGSLDPSFNAQVNSSVWAMALGIDGKLLLAGDFTSVRGSIRNRVARLNADGSLDGGFDPGTGPNSTVRKLALQPDGKVVIGGAFGSVNGQSYTYLCRLNSDGLPDLAYAGYANNVVYSLALQPDGRLLVGGEFTAAAGLPATRLARLLGSGAPDPSFDAGAGANAAIFTLALQLDGNLVAGGSFTQFNGLNHYRLVRVLGLSAASGGELEFSAVAYSISESQPSATIEVRRNGTTSGAVTVNYATSNGTATAGDYTAQSGSLVFGAGETLKTFTVPIRGELLVEDDETVSLTLSTPTGGAALGGQRTATLFIVNDDQTTAVGGVDTSFAAGSSGPVYATAVQSDGKVMVAGEFSSLLSGSRLRIGRLNVNGTLDGSFNPAAWLDNTPNVVVVQPDGRVLVGGAFTVANGVTRNRLVRYNDDGTLDGAFNPGIGPNSTVYSLLVQPNGDILVGGAFSAFNNESRGYLVRLFNDGSLDSGFNPQVNSTVWAMEREAGGKLVLGGDFNSVLGISRNRVARLNADDSLDESFAPKTGPNSTVRALSVQPDGKVVIGGAFSAVNGQGYTYLCRLNGDGLPDAGYLGMANNVVYALVRQLDGRLLVGGEFTSLAGPSAIRLGRLLGTGALDPSFATGTGANAAIITLALQPDGNLIAGGTFTQFNGLNHYRLVRVRTAENTVTVPFRFTDLRFEGGQVRLPGTAGVGQRYVLEYSRDLQTWFALATNTATAATLEFTDANPTDANRNYRVVVR